MEQAHEREHDVTSLIPADSPEHKNLQTTLRYAEQTDATADAELRRWRQHETARR